MCDNALCNCKSYFLTIPNAGRTQEREAALCRCVFQHGGGQSMINYYLSEALILARASVVSIIADAQAPGEARNLEINRMKLETARDFQTKIVITERRVLDLLLQHPGVEPKRIAYAYVVR